MKTPMDWLAEQLNDLSRGEFIALLLLSQVAGLAVGVAVVVYLPTWATILVLGALVALLIAALAWAHRRGARWPR